MKIKSVEMMINIRDQISSEIKEMQWNHEQKYLRDHIKSFDFLIKSVSNKQIQLPTKSYAPS